MSDALIVMADMLNMSKYRTVTTMVGAAVSWFGVAEFAQYLNAFALGAIGAAGAGICSFFLQLFLRKMFRKYLDNDKS